MRNFWLRVLASHRARSERRKLGPWGALAQFGVDRRMRKRLGRMENYRVASLVVLTYAMLFLFGWLPSIFLDLLDRTPIGVGRVSPAVGWIVLLSVVAVALVGFALTMRYLFLARRFTGAASIVLDLRLVVRALEDLSRLQSWRERDPLYLRSRNVKLRAARARLRTGAWVISRKMAILHGLEVREREDVRTAVLGRWICWVSEDPFEPSRIHDALRVCADAAVHFQGPLRFAPPKLTLPPRSATLVKPRRSQRIEALTRSMWARFVVFIPVFAAAVTALAVYMKK